jgi:hypothetical protein
MPRQYSTAVLEGLAALIWSWWPTTSGASREGGSVEAEHLYGILITLREGKLARWEWLDSPENALDAAAERSDASAHSPRLWSAQYSARGDDRNRTGVKGFAGPRVSHSATSPQQQD